MPPPEVQVVVAVFTVVGTVVVAWIRGWFTSSGSRPDTINSLGGRLDEAFDRLDEQDRIIRGLRDEIYKLRDRIHVDKQERHRLKSGIITLVQIARQMARAIIDHFTHQQIDALPQPSRGLVRDDSGFEEYLRMARPREGEG